MLARKISASTGASSGRNGRRPSSGCATRHHRATSQVVPSFEILQHDAHRCEFVADAVGFGEILCLAGGIARFDQAFDLAFVDCDRCADEMTPSPRLDILQ